MRFLSLAVLFFAAFIASAQEIANFTQFFVDPYTINPSFAGIEGRAGLHLTYRQQWVGFEGAPQVSNMSFHAPLSKNVNFGINANNDRNSILNMSSALITLGYTARLGEDAFLRFGISGGGVHRNIDESQVNLNDPILLQEVSNSESIYLRGNAGLSLHLSTFHIGVAIPELFQQQLFSPEEFAVGEIRPSDRFIVTASNRFYFGGGKHVFEPYAVYRVNSSLPSQYEFAAIMHLNHTVWFGGTYKQDFGISATGGIKTNKLGVGYSYTFQGLGFNKALSPTHEITLSLLFKEKKPRHQKYSFVSTIIEKDPPPKKPEPKPEPVEPEPEPEPVEPEPEPEPVEPEPKPVVEPEPVEPDPVVEEEPPVEQPKPEEKPKPVEEKPEPVEEVKPDPVEVKPDPVEEKPDPVVVTPPIITPVPEEKQPVEEAKPDPILVKPPVIEEKEPEPVEEEKIPEPDPVISTPDVVVKKGDHEKEINVGNYVVIGAFSTEENAGKFVKDLNNQGYPEARYGYLSSRGYWYVYVHETDNAQLSRSVRDSVRKVKLFKDAWTLEVRN